MYTVIGSSKTRTLRVLWLMEELGLDHEHVPAGPRSSDVTAHYPVGKVPVLLVDGVALTDSTAIMTFLADRHGGMTMPAGSVERAIQDGHTNFLLDEFDACLWSAAKHSFVLPEEERVPAVKDSLKKEFARSQKLFAERLGDGPFLMGDTMTIADILAVHCGDWATAARFEISEPAFRDYLNRLRQRPAYRKARAKPG